MATVSENLVQRLETAVSRLEALSAQRPNLAPKPTNVSASGGNSHHQLTTETSMETPAVVKAYDEVVEEPLKAFMALCSKIGGDVADAASKLHILFDLHRNFVWSAAGQPEPTNTAVLQEKLKPIQRQMESIITFQESKRNTPDFNHLASIGAAIPALGWISVKPTPAPHVKEMLDSAMFYVNRVRTGNKDNQVHADWAKSFCELFTALQKYVRQHHTTGLVWNSAPGSSPTDQPPANSGAAVRATPAAGGRATGSGPPPPPPAPPVGLLDSVSTNGGGGGSSADRQKLFAELNKGEAITSGLRKVTDDMKTHKNPSLRTQSTVPGSSPVKSAASSPAGKPTPADRPPKTELKDHKVWNVEFHKGNENVVLETDVKQAVYIYRCERSVIQIKGKVNSVTLDGCKKTSVVFDNLLAQVEVINSQGVKVQTLGTMPTISIQKTDGCQVYLSKESLNAEIVTSKSSEMNILAPCGEDDDFIEFPVPEQFKTTLSVAKKRLETTVSDIV